MIVNGNNNFVKISISEVDRFRIAKTSLYSISSLHLILHKHQLITSLNRLISFECYISSQTISRRFSTRYNCTASPANKLSLFLPRYCQFDGSRHGKLAWPATNIAHPFRSWAERGRVAQKRRSFRLLSFGHLTSAGKAFSLFMKCEAVNDRVVAWRHDISKPIIGICLENGICVS